jgi:hypothetical protein
VLSPQDLHALELFFFEWAQVLIPVLVPGANVVVAIPCCPIWCRVPAEVGDGGI